MEGETTTEGFNKHLLNVLKATKFCNKICKSLKTDQDIDDDTKNCLRNCGINTGMQYNAHKKFIKRSIMN